MRLSGLLVQWTQRGLHVHAAISQGLGAQLLCMVFNGKPVCILRATPLRSCPDESGCMFLYRKPAARSAACSGADVVLRAPRIGASEEEMDAWLHAYADALDGVAGAGGGPALPMGGPRAQPDQADDGAAPAQASGTVSCSALPKIWESSVKDMDSGDRGCTR